LGQGQAGQLHREAVVTKEKTLNFLYFSLLAPLVLFTPVIIGCHPAVMVIPSYIRTVGVEVFKNQTSYYGLETTITQNIIQQFQIDGRLGIENPEKADLVVRGIVRKYIIETILFDPKTNNVLQYRLSVIYDLAALDQQEKKTLFEDNQRIHSIFYYTPEYAGAIQQTQEQVLAQLAKDMAYSSVRRVLEGN
jgi:hypothetical protein